MQTTTPNRTKIPAPREKRGLSERDLWELWLLDGAEDLSCGSIRTFLNYLCSEGTTHCATQKASPLTRGSVDIRLRGLLADDERNHLLRYLLTPGNVGRLKEAEKDMLASKLLQHYSTEDNKPPLKVRLALTTGSSRWQDT